MMTCSIHGATQGDLPCAWCWKGGARFERLVPHPDKPLSALRETWQMRHAGHPDGRRWRWWDRIGG